VEATAAGPVGNPRAIIQDRLRRFSTVMKSPINWIAPDISVIAKHIRCSLRRVLNQYHRISELSFVLFDEIENE